MVGVVHLVGGVAVDAVQGVDVCRATLLTEVAVVLHTVSGVDGDESGRIDEQRRHGPVRIPLPVGDRIADDDDRRDLEILTGSTRIACTVRLCTERGEQDSRARHALAPGLHTPGTPRIGDEQDQRVRLIDGARLVRLLRGVTERVRALRVAGVDNERVVLTMVERVHHGEVVVDRDLLGVVVLLGEQEELLRAPADQRTERFRVADKQRLALAHDSVDARVERSIVGARSHDDDRGAVDLLRPNLVCPVAVGSEVILGIAVFGTHLTDGVAETVLESAVVLGSHDASRRLPRATRNHHGRNGTQAERTRRGGRPQRLLQGHLTRCAVPAAELRHRTGGQRPNGHCGGIGSAMAAARRRAAMGTGRHAGTPPGVT